MTPHQQRFIPGSAPSATPLILLHGSGGDEHELLPLAEEMAPGSPRLGIRGSVTIDGGFAFFHRRPDRSIDEADLSARIPALVEYIAAATEHHALKKPPVAVGFSNGAIMVAGLLLTNPNLCAAAVLFRPLSPFSHDPPCALNGKAVLIIDGENDRRRSPGDGARLAERLTRAGALVTHHLLPVGHAITELDRKIARDWVRGLSLR
jgi:phospholipase/carboxylesterase